MAVVVGQDTLAAEREPVLASESETAAIRELNSLLNEAQPTSGRLIGARGEEAEVPASVYALLQRIVHELARGRAVTVVSLHRDLSTQQAADLLNVSPPHLVKLLESGAIPFHTVGTHRRVRLEEVLAYRRRRSQARRMALTEMAREAQQMGLYE